MMLVLVPLVWLSACAKSAQQTEKDLLDQVLPPEVREQIASTVSFADVKADPSRYLGRMVMFGGIVLGAKRAKERMEIEVLQLPTESGGVPSGDRSHSEGRFLAVVNQFLDPATIEPGTPVTVVDEIKGAATRPLDDSEYSYPVIEVNRLIDWSKTVPVCRFRPISVLRRLLWIFLLLGVAILLFSLLGALLSLNLRQSNTGFFEATAAIHSSPILPTLENAPSFRDGRAGWIGSI